LKEFLNHIFDLYLILNIHVAFAITALYLVFNQEPHPAYIIFLFSSTIISYNFIRLLSFKSNRFFIKKYYVRYRQPVIWFLGFMILVSFLAFIKLNLIVQLAILPLFIITFLYNFDYKNLPKFRDNGIIKILIVGFVWAGLVVLVPNFKNIGTVILLKTLLVFFYVVMLTLGFDKRDILVDAGDLKTLPQLLPNRMFVIYLIFFLILSGLNFSIYNNPVNWLNEPVIFISTLMSYRSNTEKSFYYTAFWLEAMPILWLVIRGINNDKF